MDRSGRTHIPPLVLMKRQSCIHRMSLGIRRFTLLSYRKEREHKNETVLYIVPMRFRYSWHCKPCYIGTRGVDAGCELTAGGAGSASVAYRRADCGCGYDEADKVWSKRQEYPGYIFRDYQ